MIKFNYDGRKKTEELLNGSDAKNIKLNKEILHTLLFEEISLGDGLKLIIPIWSGSFLQSLI